MLPAESQSLNCPFSLQLIGQFIAAIATGLVAKLLAAVAAVAVVDGSKSLNHKKIPIFDRDFLIESLGDYSYFLSLVLVMILKA